MNEQTITLTAPVTCPPCGRELTGRWTAERQTAAQQCSCGHVFPATWPGWELQPDSFTVAETGPWETVRAALEARTVNPLASSHCPLSAGLSPFQSPA